MTTTHNPFEPPRTLDLEAAGGGAREASIAPEDALDELAVAAPWVRRMARVTALFLVVEVFRGVGLLSRRFAPGRDLAALLSIAADAIIAALVLTTLRRYASASERLRRGEDSAVGQIVRAQFAYFKLTAIASLIGIGLLLLQMLSPIVQRLLGGTAS